jgi:hypothetical protein
MLLWSRKDFKLDSVQLGAKVSRNDHSAINTRLLPVEDPIFDIAIVVISLLAGRDDWVDDFGLPIVFDQILKISSVCWSGIRNVMIGEPALKFSFMPFIVD